MGVEEHRQRAGELPALRAAVLTVSDTRTAETDESGALLISLLRGAGHEVADYRILKNDPEALRAAVAELLGEGRVDFVITTGGTGVSPRDLSIEAVRPLFGKELEGFGDLFRFLSYQEVGAAALLSRATAGTVGAGVVFCLPGSRAACHLAMERLILPEIRHLLSQLRKQ